jgi:hypothetical protein
MGKACSTNRETRSACRILVGKPKGKRPLGRTRRRWVDTIKRECVELRGNMYSKYNISVPLLVVFFIKPKTYQPHSYTHTHLCVFLARNNNKE